MLRKRFILLAVLIFSSSIFAQLTIDGSGNGTFGSNLTVDGYTSLGGSPSSSYKLNVQYYSNSSIHTGLYVSSTGGNGSIYTYGIQGLASAPGYINYGVYGSASGGSTNWAGYFAGNVYTTGSYQSSDKRFKKNIISLDKKDILTKVGELSPVRFQFLSNTELSQKGLPLINAKEGDHIGLIAQDLEQVFPELVMDVPQPVENANGELDETPKTVVTKAVNYQELSIVLLAAVQELKAEVEELKAKLADK